MAQTNSLIKLRTIAVKTLAQIYNSDQSLDQSLFEELTRGTSQTLPDFDRAWIYEICSGVLRYRGRLDYIIDTYSLKKKPTGALRRYLEVGVFQLLAQDVAPALAVSESVTAITQSEGQAPAKFANALFRKVSDQREEWKSWTVNPQSPFDEQLAWCSLPEWMFKKLRKERGSEWVFAFSKACLERPNTWYRELGKDEPLLLSEGYQGNEPKGYVQDISNQMLVKQAIEVIRGSFTQPRILDLCSAPGGKSLGLASAGLSVTATDLDEQRMQKVIENRARLGMNEQIKIIRHLEIWNQTGPENLWDVIWLDAPCSSSGIIRRHPEVKWNRTEKDLEKYVLKQKDLIQWAAARLTPKGIMIYSTCSVFAIENPAVVPGFHEISRFEALPQTAPHGDGILAGFFQKD